MKSEHTEVPPHAFEAYGRTFIIIMGVLRTDCCSYLFLIGMMTYRNPSPLSMAIGLMTSFTLMNTLST